MRESPTRPPDDRPRDRRRVLGACAAALSGVLAGCLVAGAPDGCPATDPPANGFELRNGDPYEYDVRVEIVQDRIVTGTTVFEETYAVATTPDTRTVRVDDVVEFAGRYVIKVRPGADTDVEARHLWTVAPDRCDGVRIAIEDGRVRFAEPGNMGVL